MFIISFVCRTMNFHTCTHKCSIVKKTFVDCLVKFQKKALFFICFNSLWMCNMYAPSLVYSLFSGEREADRFRNELEKWIQNNEACSLIWKGLYMLEAKNNSVSPSGATSFSARQRADLNTDMKLGIFPLLQRQRQ